MATSGQSAFNPSGGELLLAAFAICGVRRTALLPEHMADGRMFFNLLLGSYGAEGPNLWRVDEVVETLVPGQATYNVAPTTVMILDAFIRTNAGTESQADRIIWPYSRTEYAATPNKTLQAPPTVYWFDRQLAPTITLWQTPDDQQVYDLHYFRYAVIEDQNLYGGQNIDVPRWWMLALTYGLAEHLAAIYAPERKAAISADAARYLREAREQDVENVPMYILPAVYGYYPR